MRKLIILTIILLLSIVPLLTWWSYGLANDDGGKITFWHSFLLNLAAESVGIIIGISIPFIVGAWLASKKLRPLIELIAHLRSEEIISPKTARGGVICTVKLVSEERIKKDISLSFVHRTQNCDVCALPIEIRADKRCKHCGLKDHVWKVTVPEED